VRRALPAAALLLLSLAACARKPTTVRVDPAKQTIYGKKRAKSVAVQVLDNKGEPMPGVAIEWSSSNPSVATIDAKTGAIKTVAPGRAILTAKAGPISGTGVVEVVDAAAILVTPSRVTLAGPKGSSAQLSAEVKDSAGKALDVKPTWSSSDPGIASVDASGALRSVKEGKTTITASLGDLGGGCDVGVTFREIGSLEVAPVTLILAKGETQSVRATARDANGISVEDAAVAWTSSDPSVATCSSGAVTGRGTGSATIHASCGTKTAEISVLVN